MTMEWANYFSSKSSNQLNAIIGVWISFVFGFVSILSNVATRTILGFVAFIFLTIFVALPFYQKFRFYDAWEQFAQKNDFEIEDYKEKQKKLLNPKSERPINLIIYAFTPRCTLELILQCSVWGGFVVISLLWNNTTLQYVLLGLNTFIEGLPIEIALRHLVFVIISGISIIIILGSHFCRLFQK